MAGNIFINYRRGDDPGFAQALFGRLEQVFAADQLFMDIDDIAPGLDFVDVMNQQVSKCDVLISVIGRGWLAVVDETGGRRLDDPQDFVRLEIESALAQKKRVIPVLVNDAKMPKLTDLPESLRPFARCNAVKLSHERFRADVAGLIEALESVLTEADAARRVEEEQARRAAKARGREKKAARAVGEDTKTETDVETVPRAEPGSGLAAWIAALPSEIAWSIPLGVVGVFLLGWLLPGTLFSMRFSWGTWSLLYGIAGLVAVGVTLYTRRDLLSGSELAVYWYAALSALAVIILSAVTSLGQAGNINCDAIALGIAVATAALLLSVRREQLAGLEASVYWLGITMVAYWAFLPIVARLDWIYGLSGATSTTEAYRIAGLILAGLNLLSAAGLLWWRRSRLSGPEVAIYLMGTVSAFVAVLLLV
jgi:TIR domain